MLEVYSASLVGAVFLVVFLFLTHPNSRLGYFATEFCYGNLS